MQTADVADTRAPETMSTNEVARELNRIEDAAVHFLDPTSRQAWVNRLARRATSLGAVTLAARGRKLAATPVRAGLVWV